MAPLPNYSGQPLVTPAKDPEAFVQQLQAQILSAVLPLWSHPLAGKASWAMLSTLVRVLQVCSQGTAQASAYLRQAGGAGRIGVPRQVAPDPGTVQQIVEMGFSQVGVVCFRLAAGRACVRMTGRACYHGVHCGTSRNETHHMGSGGCTVLAQGKR